MIPPIIVLALDYYRAPMSFPKLADVSEPLPDGIDELIGSFKTFFAEDQIKASAASLGASPDECRNAVLFFIKQVLFSKHADYYRQLGLANDATTEQVKKHYRHLISVFHPDRDTADTQWNDVYVPRLNEAYNTLRNPEKRSEYDLQLKQAARSNNNRSSLQPSVATRPSRPRRSSRAEVSHRSTRKIKPLHVAVSLALVFVVILLVIVNSANKSAPRLTITESQQHEQHQRQSASRSEKLKESDIMHDPVDEPDQVSVDAGYHMSKTPITGSTDSGMEQRLETERAIQDRVEAQVAMATTAILGRSEPAPVRQVKPAVKTRPAPSKSAASPAPPVQHPSLAAWSAETTESPATNDEQENVVAVAPAASASVAENHEASLFRLIATFIDAYKQGDLERFLSLFSVDAAVTGGEGIDVIRGFYGELFSRREARDMSIRELAWMPVFDNRLSGKGQLLVTATPLSEGEVWRASGTIRFEIDTSGTKPVITGMFHEISETP